MATDSLFRPLVAGDVVLFVGDDEADARVLLITRGHPPFQGHRAFPGGLLDEGEDCAQCALRELEEETGIVGVELELLGVWSAPGRDPRGAVVSVVYVGKTTEAVAETARAGDDAAAAEWVRLRDVDVAKLAFDHADILAKARARVF